jgi:hypothetical protein
MTKARLLIVTSSAVYAPKTLTIKTGSSTWALSPKIKWTITIKYMTSLIQILARKCNGNLEIKIPTPIGSNEVYRIGKLMINSNLRQR